MCLCTIYGDRLSLSVYCEDVKVAQNTSSLGNSLRFILGIRFNSTSSLVSFPLTTKNCYNKQQNSALKVLKTI